MYNTLTDIRNDWEKNLQPIFHVDNMEKRSHHLVVLIDRRKQTKSVQCMYHCHRYMYFSVSGGWEVSVDKQQVVLGEVWQWLTQFVGEKDGPEEMNALDSSADDLKTAMSIYKGLITVVSNPIPKTLSVLWATEKNMNLAHTPEEWWGFKVEHSVES